MNAMRDAMSHLVYIFISTESYRTFHAKYYMTPSFKYTCVKMTS